MTATFICNASSRSRLSRPWMLTRKRVVADGTSEASVHPQTRAMPPRRTMESSYRPQMRLHGGSGASATGVKNVCWRVEGRGLDWEAYVAFKNLPFGFSRTSPTNSRVAAVSTNHSSKRTCAEATILAPSVCACGKDSVHKLGEASWRSKSSVRAGDLRCCWCGIHVKITQHR